MRCGRVRSSPSTAISSTGTSPTRTLWRRTALAESAMAIRPAAAQRFRSPSAQVEKTRRKRYLVLSDFFFLGYPDDTSLERWHEIYRQRKTLLDEFQWRAEIVAAVEHVLTPIKAERAYSNMIGVHARRGYFEKHSNSPHKDSNSAWAAYFNDAIDYFRYRRLYG